MGLFLWMKLPVWDQGVVLEVLLSLERSDVLFGVNVSVDKQALEIPLLIISLLVEPQDLAFAVLLDFELLPAGLTTIVFVWSFTPSHQIVDIEDNRLLDLLLRKIFPPQL